MFVRVLNKNPHLRIVDKFGGQQYVFNPGEPLNIPEDAARHIFGFGLPETEKMKKMMRMGLANHKDRDKIWSRIEVKAAGNPVPTGEVREVS